MRVLLYSYSPKRSAPTITYCDPSKEDERHPPNLGPFRRPFSISSPNPAVPVTSLSWRTCSSIASTTLTIHNYEPLGPEESTAIPIGSLRKRKGHCTGRHAAPGSSIALLAYYNAVYTSGSRCSSLNPVEICLLWLAIPSVHIEPESVTEASSGG